MERESKQLTSLPEWRALTQHQAEIAKQSMRDWFLADRTRAERYLLKVGGLALDYSRNRINDETLALLLSLAKARNLKQSISDLFSGHFLNVTENRNVFHTALRNPHTSNPIGEQITETLHRMQVFTKNIHRGEWRGATGKPIQHIVTIGMGGSIVGPKMCTEALSDYAISPLRFHFISSLDDHLRDDILKQIDPEATLFIVSSKTFTTFEVMANATYFLEWMQRQIHPNVLKNHFVAITADTEKALGFGVPPENIFPIWEWVGGRYSIWSAIGLPLMLLIGSQLFDEFLGGAKLMDDHFQTADFSCNLPVILALIGIWNINFFNANALAIVPYSHRLRDLIAFIRQTDMESNGKRVTLHGETIHYHTSPVIFGEEGCHGQHAYHQLLHQGTTLIPVDFILIRHPHAGHSAHHHLMFASGVSQAQALMQGKSFEEARSALLSKQHDKADADTLAKHQVIPGNKPSNLLCLDRLNPKNLGLLMALYEHKIFVQGIIWEINSFDQWGVELGKQLLSDQLTSKKPILETVSEA